MDQIEFCINYSDDDDKNKIEFKIKEFITELEGSEFLVCDEENADEKAEEYIKDSLWAFKTSFILSHTKINSSDKLEKCLEKIQGELCEDANPLIEAIIPYMESFIEDAINADGRGHFLNTYDDEEHEFEYGGKTYYIYRTN